MFVMYNISAVLIIMLFSLRGAAQVMPQPASDGREFNPRAEKFATPEDSIQAAWFWYEEGRKHEATGAEQNEWALDFYARALELNPRIADAALRRSRLLCEYRRWEAAITCLGQALQFSPGNPDLWEVKGRAHLGLDRPEEMEAAITCFDHALQFNPDRVSLWDAKAKAHLSLRQIDASRSAYHRAAALMPERTESFYRELTGYCESRGWFDDALEVYHDAQLAIPNEGWVWRGCGDVLFWWLERKDDGLAFLEKALEVDSNDAESHASMAIALDEIGKVEEALIEWDAAISLVTDDADRRSWFTFQKGELLARARKTAESEAVYLKALEDDPKNDLAWYDLGIVRRRLKKPLEQQLAAFEHANDNQETWLARCAILRNLNRTDEASAAYDSSLRRMIEAVADPVDASENLFNEKQYALFLSFLDYITWNVGEFNTAFGLGYRLETRAEALAVQKDFNRAQAAADSCIALGIESDHSWSVKGRAQVNSGHIAEAESAYFQAVLKNPKQAEHWRELGTTQFMLGRYTEAATSCSSAIHLGHNDAIMWEKYGLACYCLNRNDEARSAFLKATSLANRAESFYYLARAEIRLEKKTDTYHNLKIATALNPVYRDSAKTDEAFGILWNEPEFMSVVDDTSSSALPLRNRK